jgi:hypothetical protein
MHLGVLTVREARGNRGRSSTSEEKEGFTEGESSGFTAARQTVSEREESVVVLGLQRQAVQMGEAGRRWMVQIWLHRMSCMGLFGNGLLCLLEFHVTSLQVYARDPATRLHIHPGITKYNLKVKGFT